MVGDFCLLKQLGDAITIEDGSFGWGGHGNDIILKKYVAIPYLISFLMLTVHLKVNCIMF